MSFGMRAVIALLGPIADDGAFDAFRHSPTRPAPHYILVISAGAEQEAASPPDFLLTFAGGANIRAAAACHDRLHPEHGNPAFRALVARLATGEADGGAIPCTTCRFDETGFGLTIGGPDPAAPAAGQGAAYIDVDLNAHAGGDAEHAIPLPGRPIPADGYYGITLEDPALPWALSVRVEPASQANRRAEGAGAAPAAARDAPVRAGRRARAG